MRSCGDGPFRKGSTTTEAPTRPWRKPSAIGGPMSSSCRWSGVRGQPSRFFRSVRRHRSSSTPSTRWPSISNELPPLRPRFSALRCRPSRRGAGDSNDGSRSHPESPVQWRDAISKSSKPHSGVSFRSRHLQVRITESAVIGQRFCCQGISDIDRPSRAACGSPTTCGDRSSVWSRRLAGYWPGRDRAVRYAISPIAPTSKFMPIQIILVRFGRLRRCRSPPWRLDRECR